MEGIECGICRTSFLKCRITKHLDEPAAKRILGMQSGVDDPMQLATSMRQRVGHQVQGMCLSAEANIIHGVVLQALQVLQAL